jgi:hypothetical protein
MLVGNTVADMSAAVHAYHIGISAITLINR